MQGTTLITENKAPVFQIKPSVSLLFNILLVHLLHDYFLMIKTYFQRLAFKFEVGIDKYVEYSCGKLGYAKSWTIPPWE